MKQHLALGLLLCLGGCASAPNHIAGDYVDDAPYRSLSCEQLRAEAHRLMEVGKKSYGWQNLEHSSIFGLPAQLLTDNAAGRAVAHNQGQLDAVGRVINAKDCPGPLPLLPVG